LDLTTAKQREVSRENYPMTTAPFPLSVAIRKPNSPCRRPKKVVDDVDAAVTSFIEVVMERPKPPYHIVVAGEEEKTNFPCHKT
jgi:hypothetical protein